MKLQTRPAFPGRMMAIVLAIFLSMPFVAPLAAFAEGTVPAEAATVPAGDVPAADETTLAEDEDVPAAAENLPATEEDVPAEGEDAPAAAEDTPLAYGRPLSSSRPAGARPSEKIRYRER